MDLASLPTVDTLIDEFVAKLGCHAQGSYPKTQTSESNPGYADLLMPAFADGSSAEFTAIAQYFQHSLTITDKQVANAELCIAMTEMKHLELLGEMIKSFGGMPKYGRSQDWSASTVTYGNTAVEKLQADIDSEQATINAYQGILGQLTDPQAQQVIQRIIADEQVHMQLFQEAHARLAGMEKGTAPEATSQQPAASLISRLAASQKPEQRPEMPRWP